MRVSQAQQHEFHCFSLRKVLQQLWKGTFEQLGVRRRQVMLTGRQRLQVMVLDVGEYGPGWQRVRVRLFAPAQAWF